MSQPLPKRIEMPKGPPKVKNGPNRGQERARNKPGGFGKPPQWRKKRDDTGVPRAKDSQDE